MFFRCLLGAALALAATANPIRDHQQPVFSDGFNGQQVDLIKEFVFIYSTQWSKVINNVKSVF